MLNEKENTISPIYKSGEVFSSEMNKNIFKHPLTKLNQKTPLFKNLRKFDLETSLVKIKYFSSEVKYRENSSINTDLKIREDYKITNPFENLTKENNKKLSFTPDHNIMHNDTNSKEGFGNFFSESKSVGKPTLNISKSRNLISMFKNNQPHRIKEDDMISETSLTSLKACLSKSSIYENENDISQIPLNVSLIKEEESGADETLDSILFQEYESSMFVPKEKKNDETYKILKIKKEIKSTEMPQFSSAKKIKDLRVCDRSNDDCLDYNFLARRKKVHSVKRIFCSEFPLYNKVTKSSKNFKIFRDSDIGIHPYWQAHLITNNHDDDVETDEDQCQLSQLFAIDQLNLALDLLDKHTAINVLNNYKLN